MTPSWSTETDHGLDELRLHTAVVSHVPIQEELSVTDCPCLVEGLFYTIYKENNTKVFVKIFGQHFIQNTVVHLNFIYVLKALIMLFSS